MILTFVVNLAWLLTLVGGFMAFQFWQLRQIEREMPRRAETPERR